jgi:tripartite-type tricarboxylate transporter receptor subunit TctC
MRFQRRRNMNREFSLAFTGMQRFGICALLVGQLLFVRAQTVYAQQPFYQGKTVRILVSSAAGGGSDTTARILARHLPRHIPGNPAMIVENMPGGGDVVGINYVYNIAKPDGLTLLFSTGAPITQLLNHPEMKFDILKMHLVGGSSESVAAFIRNDKTGIKSVGDLTKPTGPIILGGTQVGSIKDLSLRVAMNLLDVKTKYVTGYGGSGPARLAFERGEINFTQESAATITSSVMQWTKEGWTSILYQVGFLGPKGNVIKDPVWTKLGVDLPTVGETYKVLYGKEPSGTAWEAAKALVGGYSLTRIMAFSPGVPADRVTELRAAFKSMTVDSAFQEELQKRGSAARFLFGDEAQEVAATIINSPKESVDLLRKLATLN